MAHCDVPLHSQSHRRVDGPDERDVDDGQKVRQQKQLHGTKIGHELGRGEEKKRAEDVDLEQKKRWM